MRCSVLAIVAMGFLASHSLAQDLDQGLPEDFVIGDPTFDGSEPLYSYDDLDPWKHGWIQIMPYYGGFHSYRPYNYKQVFAQSAQSAAWGMPRSMPYSQQFYHRYENLPGSRLGSLPAMNRSPYGPDPSAMHQPQWDALRRSPLLNAGFDHRQGAASPESVAPVNFPGIHQSPADGPEYQRRAMQRARLEQLLYQAAPQNRPARTYEPLPAPGSSRP